jgi:hypothetical protein
MLFVYRERHDGLTRGNYAMWLLSSRARGKPGRKISVHAARQDVVFKKVDRVPHDWTAVQFFGTGGDRSETTRTLSRLRECADHGWASKCERHVGRAGVEPATLGFEDRCSIH